MRIMSSSSIHVAANARIAFFLIAVYVRNFIHSSVDGHLGCFCILTLMTSVTINMEVHISLPYLGFISFAYI